MKWFDRVWLALVMSLFIGTPVWAQEAETDSLLSSEAAIDSVVMDSMATATLTVDSLASDTLMTEEEAAAAIIDLIETATPETAETMSPHFSVPVFLGGSEIFRIRTERNGLSPTERAANIRTRLNRAVGDPQIAADSVAILSTPEGIEVRLGPHFLWLMTPGDLGTDDPVDIASRLARLPDEIKRGVIKEREARRPIRLLISAGIAVLIALVAFVALKVLLSLGRRWRVWLRAVLGKKLPSIRVRSFEVISRRQMAEIVANTLGRLDFVAGLFLFYAFITLEFSLFPWTQGWGWFLFNFAARQAIEGVRIVAHTIPNLLIIVVILFLFRLLSRVSDRFFDSVESGKVVMGEFHPELARPSKRLARLFLIIVAIMVAYPYIPGGQSRAVQGITLLIGIMVSLGSTGVVGNILSGLVLTYSRAFRVGDRVRIGAHVGDVVSLGFFSTKLRSPRNEEITIPNGLATSDAVMNYTRLAGGAGLILHSEVTIGYDVEWRRVHALLIEAAIRVEGIEGEPEPWVFQRSLNDYHVSYEINAVTHRPGEQLRIYSDLHAEIQDAFARAGVEILSPAYQALRDAHAPAIPSAPEGPRRDPGAFQVRGPETKT